jgi:hypothetical protein
VIQDPNEHAWAEMLCADCRHMWPALVMHALDNGKDAVCLNCYSIRTGTLQGDAPTIGNPNP